MGAGRYVGVCYSVNQLITLDYQTYRDYVFDKLWLSRNNAEWRFLLDMKTCKRTVDILEKIKGQTDNAMGRQECQGQTELAKKTRFVRDKAHEWMVAAREVLAMGGEPTKDDQLRLRAIIEFLVKAIAQHREQVSDAEGVDPFPEDLALWAALDKTTYRPMAGGGKLPIALVVDNDWWVSAPSNDNQHVAAGSGADPG